MQPSTLYEALRSIVYYSPFRIERKDYEVFKLITSVEHYTEEAQRLYDLAKKKVDRAVQLDLIEV
jgi:hypothetical protein